MKAGISFPVGELRLNRGDTLLLYTDGLPEARNGKGDEFEYGNLREQFRRLAVTDRCRTLVDDLDKTVRDHIGNKETGDDMTLLAFRYWGPGGQKMLRRSDSTSVRRMPDAPAE